VPPRKRAGEGAGGVLPRSRTRTRSPAARPILRGTSLRRPGARARGGRRLSRKSAAADSTSGPAASPDVAAHEPAARPPIGRWGGGRRAKSTTAREAQAKCRARARGSVGRVAAAGGSPAPSARLMSARRGVACYRAMTRRKAPETRFRGSALVRETWLRRLMLRLTSALRPPANRASARPKATEIDCRTGSAAESCGRRTRFGSARTGRGCVRRPK